METRRMPTMQERKLLHQLVTLANMALGDGWSDQLSVRPMVDGGMGSLRLFPGGNFQLDRRVGKLVSEMQFQDRDGVAVVASLYLDEEGKLFELDMWKTDFSRLISFPD